MVPSTPEPTEYLPRVGEVAPKPWWRRPATIAAAAVLFVLAVLYVLDLALSSGEVPRGTTVAGVAIGGMSEAAAEQKLRDELTPRLGRPVQVIAGDRQIPFVPAEAGVRVDAGATVAAAGAQPLNPWTRLVSLFRDREIAVVAGADPGALTATLDELRAAVDRPVVEGGIRFDGTTPVPIDPRAGQALDTARAEEVLLTGWATAERVQAPVLPLPPKTTPEGVRAALDEVALPAVAAPATVRGDSRDVALEPAQIAAALTFQPGDNGTLVPRLDRAKLGALADQLAPTEKPGQDARMRFDNDRPAVVPSVDGRAVDWDQTLGGLLEAIRPGGDRTTDAQYVAVPARITTDRAGQLGITEVIGEFTTGNFAPDSGVNIRVVAEKVSGAIVLPGETFSLNGYTGPREAAQGYVEAGVIEEGVPEREVGGGISQFATTLYNAAYFAGMTDVEHKEHSYYISRYPAGRDATVFQNPDGSSVIDLKFANEFPTGVAIQTIWTPKSITVRLWGTRHVTVESVPGPRGDYVDPHTVTKPAGSTCQPARGKPGFRTTDTRIVRDLSGAEISRTTRTVRYDPEPTVRCGG
ncbi:VanW family protein [Amycolatopsis tucumanensis]|uniref:VanW family protein n=1 Tax=Amycolatopsis tucumanensis TaxID=401106 RepID=A0ABP7HH09_9PSEU|nr:VanW family protein [Amycolatopsis tucumanensis]MCF6421630.1 VanW family protein [Amycolatopsis tucumanensis]